MMFKLMDYIILRVRKEFISDSDLPIVHQILFLQEKEQHIFFVHS